MKNFFLFLLILISPQFLSAQANIAEARAMSVGSTVTVTGIATHGAEMGVIRYIQDETGGIAIYDPAIDQDINEGDEVTVTGELVDYNGLLEISNTTAHTIVSSGNNLPEIQIITPTGMSESNEAELVTVENVTFDNGGATFSGNSTYSFSNADGSGIIYVRTGHALEGTQIPLAAVSITGIVSQFNSYQLLPRDADDIEIVASFYLTENATQENLGTTSFSVTWQTNVASSSGIRYGVTEAFELGEVTVANNTIAHSITLTGLQPAQCYFVQAFSSDGTTEAVSDVQIYSTVSTSSGEMKVYFNACTDTGVSSGTDATYLTGAGVEEMIICMIDQAENTIDMCAYNINRDPIVYALNAAKDRGVVVRYIANSGTANLALANAEFQHISGNSDALMHNKFIVVDRESMSTAKVFLGSMNFTQTGLIDEFNNVMTIQDKALARAYTIEFEEMWGSSGPTPGLFTRKFGDQKTQNTPQKFMIGGRFVELYFSPSDNPTSNIVRALNSADTDLEFAMFSFTRNELGQAVLDAHNNGVNARGMIESINDLGGEYQYLLDNGVNVQAHTPSHTLHHKYGIVDATNPDSDPLVITGSHNWSSAAENINDENTLIIHDATIANMYYQEWTQRWNEVVNNAACSQDPTELEVCLTATEFVHDIAGFETTMFPLPATDVLNISMTTEQREDITITIFDAQGRLVNTYFHGDIEGQVVEQLDVRTWAKGSYYVSFQIGDQAMTKMMQVF